MRAPQLYGLEFALLPAAGLPYFVVFGDFTVPVALLNNALLTALCAGAATYWSKRLGRLLGRRLDSLQPVWPALVGLLLFFLAGLQLILAVSHLSWYRTKDFPSAELFGR